MAGKFWREYKLLILAVGIFVLIFNPLNFLGAIFNFGESQVFPIVNEAGNKDWFEGDRLEFDNAYFDAWYSQQSKSSSVSFGRSGSVIILDDKIYSREVGGADRSMDNLALFSDAWFSAKGYAVPDVSGIIPLSAGSHYVEFMYGRSVSYGENWNEIGWGGGATIIVKGKPVVKPVCESGTYNPVSNTCDTLISETRIVCPEGSSLVDGVCETLGENVVVEGEIVHKCVEGEWVDGKCKVVVSEVEYESDKVIVESDTDVKISEESDTSSWMSGFVFAGTPWYVWVVLMVFAVVMFLRFRR